MKKKMTLTERVTRLETWKKRAERELHELAELPAQVIDLRTEILGMEKQMQELSRLINATLHGHQERVDALDARLVIMHEDIIKSIGQIRPCAAAFAGEGEHE